MGREEGEKKVVRVLYKGLVLLLSNYLWAVEIERCKERRLILRSTIFGWNKMIRRAASAAVSRSERYKSDDLVLFSEVPDRSERGETLVERLNRVRSRIKRLL